MKTDNLKISETLESIRLEKGLSKGEFSELCKISNSFYSELIGGKKSLSINRLEEICRNIEVPVDIFIFKAINEDAIKDNEKRRLVREIRPLMEKIAKLLYDGDVTNVSSSSTPNDLDSARKEILRKAQTAYSH